LNKIKINITLLQLELITSLAATMGDTYIIQKAVPLGESLFAVESQLRSTAEHFGELQEQVEIN
jgi:hypothetical protein